MAFTTTEVNGWFQTIDGLPPTTASISSSLATMYVGELNATPPTATPGDIQANLENFAAPPEPPPFDPTGLFYRTSVAQFVLREFQAAWGVVPSTGAGSQYDHWVARIIANPSLEGGGMSQALAGTPQFLAEYGLTSATEPASLAFITALAANLGVAVGPGAIANEGLPVWQVLQNFVTSPTVITSLEAPIANFQNLLLAGAAPGGSILDLPPPTQSLTLTIGVDSPTTGFTSGHGATATAAGSVFNALPASNPPLGVTNTLNAGDDLLATGAAAGDSTLNYTAVNSLFLANGPNPTAVTMNGVSTANITSATTFATAGFSGNITGLTTVTASTAVAGNEIELGRGGIGLNTALTDITLKSNLDFVGWMTAAAFGAGTDTATVHLTGVDATAELNVTTGATGYGSLTVDSGGSSANTLELDTNATNTAKITVTGAENLDIFGSAMNIGNLHTFDASATIGGVEAWFNGTGAVAATGGSGDDAFHFETTPGGTATFTPASSVDGGGGTNVLDIQADSGGAINPILVAGDGPNIKNIQTIEHTTTGGGATSDLTADLAGMGSATTFDLAGTYNAHNVSISDITNAQTVEYSGAGLADLTLAHTTPLGLVAQINFEMNGSGPGPLTLGQLTVGPGLASLNIDSTGAASDNVITNVSTINDSVTITGGTHLTFGSAGPGDQYSFTHGIIDASGDTGGVDNVVEHGRNKPRH